jgi:hypothetical protein
MKWKVCAPLALVAGSLVGMAGGCSPSNAPAVPVAEAFEYTKLSEIGEIFRIHAREQNRAPAKLSDAARYEIAFPVGFKALKDGAAVVFWSAPIKEGDTSTVLAYEKQVPQEGGFVLMQDGTTVKKMTAEEFKSAAKAGSSTPSPTKGTA